jgi:hypothetical protein
MTDTRKPAPAGVKLSDLKDVKQKSQFITDHGYDAYAKLVTDETNAQAAQRAQDKLIGTVKK